MTECDPNKIKFFPNQRKKTDKEMLSVQFGELIKLYFNVLTIYVL